MRPFKLITNMNDEKLLKKENTIKTRTKNKLNTEVFKVKQKVRESICIRILDDSIFVKFQPLNKYSKSVKKEMWLTRKDWYSRLNYCKELQKTQEQNGLK